MAPPIASGRSADIYAEGPGRVRRTYRDGHDARIEVAVMRAVAAAGYPVPAVLEADGPDMVLERVEGPTLAGYLAGHPWRYRWGAGVLSDLIDRLAAIPRIEGLPTPFGDPGADGVVLHLDLHPMNVLLGPDGPVVIDWPNAAWGPADLERAFSWLLISTSDLPVPRLLRRPAGLGQRALAGVVLPGSSPSRSFVPAVTRYRLLDRNVTPVEAARLRAIIARV